MIQFLEKRMKEIKEAFSYRESADKIYIFFKKKEKSIPIIKIKSETDLICPYTPSYSYSEGYVASHIVLRA